MAGHRSASPGGARPPPPAVPRARRRPSPRNGRVRPNLPLVEVDVPRGATDHWVREATDRWKLRARLELCRPLGRGGAQMLQVVELTGAAEDLDAAERSLRRRPTTSEATVLALSPNRRFVRAVTATPEACRRAFEAGATCRSCHLLPPDAGRLGERWTLVLPGTRRALRLVGRLGPDDRGAGRRLLRMRRFVPPRAPTPRQATALETAYRLGYYAFPRRAHLGELARALSVSRSTAAELLRRAEGTVLARELGRARA